MLDSVDVVRVVGAMKKNIAALEDIASLSDLKKFSQDAENMLRQIKQGTVKLEKICIDNR